jgi:uncharacterized protein YndB with AHSA1/START domain
MVTTNKSATTTLTLPSERELVIERVFDAPRALVFEAVTKPEYVARWYGPRRLQMVLCEIDLRVGGAWRYLLRDADGNEHGFGGVYREIVPPERIVTTEGYEGLPGHEYLTTMTLAEEPANRTKLRSHLLYQNSADRDGHIQSGMEPGMRETLDRLAELLATLA